MPYSPSTRAKRIIVIVILVMVGGSLIIPATTHAHGTGPHAAIVSDPVSR